MREELSILLAIAALLAATAMARVDPQTPSPYFARAYYGWEPPRSSQRQSPSPSLCGLPRAEASYPDRARASSIGGSTTKPSGTGSPASGSLIRTDR